MKQPDRLLSVTKMVTGQAARYGPRFESFMAPRLIGLGCEAAQIDGQSSHGDGSVQLTRTPAYGKWSVRFLAAGATNVIFSKASGYLLGFRANHGVRLLSLAAKELRILLDAPDRMRDRKTTSILAGIAILAAAVSWLC